MIQDDVFVTFETSVGVLNPGFPSDSYVFTILRFCCFPITWASARTRAYMEMLAAGVGGSSRFSLLTPTRASFEPGTSANADFQHQLIPSLVF